MIYIKANNIQFSYENQQENILENISFTLSNKSKIGLIGNNGSGKSTILKLINHEITPISGTIYIKNDLTLGILHQEMKFDISKTVRDFMWSFNEQLGNLRKKMENLELYSQKDILDTLEKFEDLDGYRLENSINVILQKIGFTENIYDQKIKYLSGGEKTKIALGKILLQKPNILILDEPTTTSIQRQ